MNERKMKPEEMEELLGAYALDAVDDDERRAVDEYLATNPRARAEVEQHREVATMLAFSGTTAPDGLWDRIAGALDERAPEPGPELAKVLPMANRPSARRRPTPLVAAVLGAAAALVVALLAFVVIDRGDSSTQAIDPITEMFGNAVADPASRQLDLKSADGTATAKVVVEPDGTAFLAAKTLPELADDRTYQLWGVTDDGRTVSLGVLGNRPGIEMFSVNGPTTALAITEEVSGGVVQSANPATVSGVL